MMACHAVVQRIITESLGIIPSPDGTCIRPAAVLDPPAQLDMAPNFADDGLLAGPASEVLRALQHCKRILPTLGLRFSSLVLSPAAGVAHQVDLAPFRAEGCSIVEDGNIEVLKSPCGDPDFCANYCRETVQKHSKAFESLRAVEDPHVCYYLLRWSANASRMNYLARTTPVAFCGKALEEFDLEVKHTFCSTTGLALDDSQWMQATFSSKQAGLGLRSAAATADAAYLGSRADTFELCAGIRDGLLWDYDRPGSYVEQSGNRLRALFDCDFSEPKLTQHQLSRKIEKSRIADWQTTQRPDAQCRRNAYSAQHAGMILGVTPSPTLDKCLSKSDFVISVAERLGVDVCEGDIPCGFCGMPLDSLGRHCHSCMSGGDHNLLHTDVRNLVFSYLERARLRPDRETPRLLANIQNPEPGRRPADVLICSSSVFASTLPDGTPERMPPKIAFDFAIVNALGRGHWQETLGAPGAAASGYAEYKRNYRNTAQQCEQAGIRFQPMIFETQGGAAKETAAILHKLAKALAQAEGSDQGKCNNDILQRIALIIARHGASAVKRRRRLIPCVSADASIRELQRSQLLESAE